MLWETEHLTRCHITVRSDAGAHHHYTSLKAVIPGAPGNISSWSLLDGATFLPNDLVRIKTITLGRVTFSEALCDTLAAFPTLRRLAATIQPVEPRTPTRELARQPLDNIRALSVVLPKDGSTSLHALWRRLTSSLTKLELVLEEDVQVFEVAALLRGVPTSVTKLTVGKGDPLPLALFPELRRLEFVLSLKIQSPVSLDFFVGPPWQHIRNLDLYNVPDLPRAALRTMSRVFPCLTSLTIKLVILPQEFGYDAPIATAGLETLDVFMSFTEDARSEDALGLFIALGIQIAHTFPTTSQLRVWRRVWGLTIRSRRTELAYATKKAELEQA